MILRSVVILSLKNALKRENSTNRLFSNQVDIKITSTDDTSQLNEANIKADQEWRTAVPFQQIPGPSRMSMIMDFIPGGRFTNLALSESMMLYRKEYGDIFRLRGVFGKPDVLVSFDPNDFQKIYRTEGIWPIRRGLDTLEYYRRKMRPDVYHCAGLAVEQEKQWADFRTIVNPVMMQPKTVKLYVPPIDKVAAEFITRIKQIRDPVSLELPDNFEDELNRWALESIGVIALDTHLGLIGNLDRNTPGQKLIEATKTFFLLLSELDFKPSPWKLFKTPNFIKLMKSLDIMTEVSNGYVQEAKKRLDADSNTTKSKQEQSVLEKLLLIDPKIATVMANDMIIAGVDTTSSGFVSILYNLAKNPEKQETLRQELLTILVEKDAALTTEKMIRMPYLRACIKESFRLLPVVSGNFRETGQDIVLGGYQVPKGVGVSMQAVDIQREEQYYPHATNFLPERWLKGQEKLGCPSAKSVNPFVFLPFGFGPRMCIGRRFAELEMEVLISKVIRNFYVEWNHPDIKYKTTTLNVPDCKLLFKLIDVEK